MNCRKMLGEVMKKLEKHSIKKNLLKEYWMNLLKRPKERIYMFKPNKQVLRCPICGAPLQFDNLNQFEVPIGYSVHCLECSQYSDIWVNGLREVQCGQWHSPDYESDYGTMTKKEKWQERKILWNLNMRIVWHRLSHEMKQMLGNLRTWYKGCSINQCYR